MIRERKVFRSDLLAHSRGCERCKGKGSILISESFSYKDAPPGMRWHYTQAHMCYDCAPTFMRIFGGGDCHGARLEPIPAHYHAEGSQP